MALRNEKNCGVVLQAGRPKNSNFFASICHAITTRRSRKSGYGPLVGCRSGLDRGPFENFFLTKFEPKNRENLHCLFWSGIAIDRAWSNSREGALDVRESREQRDKIVPVFSPEKQERRNFGLKVSTFFSRIACCSRGSTSA